MQDPQQVAEAFVDAFNRHDEAAIRDFNADDGVLEAPGGVHLEGREATTQYGMTWLRAFPDARITVRNQIAAGDTVVQEFTFEGEQRGTLSGPAGDIPPTNRHVTGRGVQIVRVRDGEVFDTRLYFDQVEVLTQLGIMSEPAAA